MSCVSVSFLHLHLGERQELVTNKSHHVITVSPYLKLSLVVIISVVVSV